MNIFKTDNIEKCIVCARPAVSQKKKIVTYRHQEIKNFFSYIECECSHIYLQNRPKESEIINIYTPKFNNYYHFSKTIGLISSTARGFILKLKLINIKNNYLNNGSKEMNIIDIGCGDGKLIADTKKFFGNKINYYAQDIYPGLRNKFESQNIHFIQGQLEYIKFDKKFDLIFCNQVIEHVPDPQKFFSKLRSLLSDAGILIIETPNSNCIERDIFKNYWAGLHAPQHFHVFNNHSIKKNLENAGLTILNIKSIYATWNWITSCKNISEENNNIIMKFIGRLNNPFSLLIFFIIDLFLKLFSFNTSNMQIILTKSASSESK